MEPTYNLEDLTPEEMQSLTEEMQAVLAKYNCEMGVRSSIEIMKRVPVQPNDGTQPTKTEETTEVHQTDSSSTT